MRSGDGTAQAITTSTTNDGEGDKVVLMGIEQGTIETAWVLLLEGSRLRMTMSAVERRLGETDITSVQAKSPK